MRSMFLRTFLLLLLLALLTGCAPEEPEAMAPGTAATAAEEPEPAAEPVRLGGFQTPESVLFDPEQNVYFVSNINGAPLDKDDNGFISRINAEDHQIETRWIDGAADNVMLSAPKGMALVGAELWVTDIDVVRRFDRQTGEPRGEIPVPGSTFLNDLATASESSAYVTDSGMTAGEGGFEPAGTDAVYRVDRNGEIETLASGADLRGPNGVAADDRGVWVVTFGANELYRLADGARADVTELPAGSLDGLVILEDGSFLVSSWDANAVYRGKPGETFRVVVPGVNSPADLGHDPTRDLILVPLFMENAVLLIPESTAADSSPAAESATE